MSLSWVTLIRKSKIIKQKKPKHKLPLLENISSEQLIYVVIQRIKNFNKLHVSCMYCMSSITHYLTLSWHLTLAWTEMFSERQQGRHLTLCSRQAGAFQYETFKSAKGLQLLRSTLCQSIKSRIILIHLIAGPNGTWITWIMAVISGASWQIVFLRK